ncbi:MAG TPA: hypothetical protein VH370_19605 [Humisphaera sp.]|jgi:hypothetical protein|nr:hypothetical protein [Humisphaera sp.]
MRSFRQIHASYLATDGFLAQQVLRGTAAAVAARWSSVRFYNDQAYYVMLFAQYYDLRCDIAHGTALAYGTIVIPTAVQDFRQFARELKQ